MITYTVQSLPLRDVISDLAREFRTSYKEECGLYSVNLPSYIGKGTIKGINFNNGLGLIMYNCTFNEDVSIEFTVDQIHPLKYLYCLKGHMVHKFSNARQKEHKIEKYLNIIAASSRHHGHILEFKKQVKTHINSLEINRSQFAEHLNCQLDVIDNDLKNVMLDLNASQPFLYDGDYSLRTARVFQEIKDFKYENFLLHGFLNSKTWEILVYQTIQYNRTLEKQKVSSTSRNLEIVREATKKIDLDFQVYDTNEKLAAEMGLSSRRLQHLFKTYNHTTLNKYMMERRMELIIDLIENTDKPLSEICEVAGIKSKSYLSKIFQNAYSMTPSEYRNQHRA